MRSRRLSEVEQVPSDDPLLSPHSDLLQVPDQLMATAPFETPSIGLALTGREQGMKNTLLLAYGGDQNTELSVYLALEWLSRQQGRDGSWRLDGPYSEGSSGEIVNRLAATSMALLAFQGAGFTPTSTRQMISPNGQKIEVDYRKVLRRGWKVMLGWQDKNGCFYRKSRVDHAHHKLYSQAQATIALCELYAMTRDSEYRRAAQRAVNYCCEIQDRDGVYPDGGWKYDEGQESDMSVTGWFVMALQSARMAGLDVPSDVFSRIEEFLDSVTDEGSFYCYMPGAYAKHSLTAEGLLCRQYMGWDRDDPRLIKGVEYLIDRPIAWNDTNTYYWYYATQVMHHMEGDYWYGWNEVMKQENPSETGNQRSRTRELVAGGRYLGAFRGTLVHDLPVHLHAGSLLPASTDLRGLALTWSLVVQIESSRDGCGTSIGKAANAEHGSRAICYRNFLQHLFSHAFQVDRSGNGGLFTFAGDEHDHKVRLIRDGIRKG